MISSSLGWRAALLLLSAAFLVVAGGLCVFLPRLPPSMAVGLSKRLTVLRRSNAKVVLPLTVLGMAASYLPYAYSALALQAVGIAGVLVPLMLLLYGAGAVAGNLVTGIATDRWGPVPVLRACHGLMATAFAALWMTGVSGWSSVAVAGAASLTWGASTWMQTPPQQHRLIAATPTEAPLLMALQSSAIYVGIGIGSVLGGVAVAVAPASMFGMAAAGSLLAFVYLTATAGPRRIPRPGPTAGGMADAKGR